MNVRARYWDYKIYSDKECISNYFIIKISYKIII